MSRTPRLPVADDVVRRLVAALRATQLYAADHPLRQRAITIAHDRITELVADQSALTIGIVAEDIVVGDTPLAKSAENHDEWRRRFHALTIDRVRFERGVTRQALSTFIATLASGEPNDGRDALATLQELLHISVGRITLEERIDASAADMATLRRLYGDAVKTAAMLWDAAQHDGRPDPLQTRQLVDELAEAVAHNRTALMALTALKDYDNYTFTHMVNVSILTMAQARALGIDGTLLREFGIAGLMHDIGKVRTPLEILTKPERLTDAEFAIMRMHVIDGAEILRQTVGMPALASIVAFEHHLRIDGTGYPVGVTRTTLNLATMLCSIADVYDAMRSQRGYQEAFASDRILAVLRRDDGAQFNPHLVRRFSQLMGIYPPGTLVRLDTGEAGVVLRVHAPDPYRPRVRIIAGVDAQPLARPYDVNLWAIGAEPTGPTAIISSLDPGLLGIDPLTYL